VGKGGRGRTPGLRRAALGQARAGQGHVAEADHAGGGALTDRGLLEVETALGVGGRGLGAAGLEVQLRALHEKGVLSSQERDAVFAAWGCFFFFDRAATEKEILDAVRLIAQTEGIFTEPAGGTTLACAIKLIENGSIPRDESLVVCITGNGYKTAEVMASSVRTPVTLGRALSEFDAFMSDGEKTPVAQA